MADSKMKKQKRKGWSVWEPHREKIERYITMGVSVPSIKKILCTEEGVDGSVPSLYKWLYRQNPN